MSLPRLFVAALFAVSALAAIAGAQRIPDRRTWWLAVGVVSGAVSGALVGGLAYLERMGVHGEAPGLRGGAAVGALAAAGIVFLWCIARRERRDRRRVLGVLGLFAVTSLALSVVALLSGEAAYSGGWAAGAVFVAQLGQSLAGVAFVFAVLAGVAPRLVLPADWAIRRAVDAHTIDAPTARTSGATASNAARS